LDSEFDYTNVDTDDVTARRVASEMTGCPLAPLSPEQIALREIERETQQELYRQQEELWRHELEQKEAARAAQEKAEFLAEHRQRKIIRQQERQHQIDREVNRRGLMDLRMSAARRDAFERDVRESHAQGVRQQYRQTLLGELDAMINAPKPEVSDSFAARYRNNQRSGLYYMPEDSDE
jgi:hypothetical protein